MIEAWGCGYERILEACAENGTLAPEEEYEPSGLGLVFPFLPKHRSSGPASVEKPASPVETDDTPVETLHAPVETDGTPVETAERILSALRSDPQLPLADVAEQIGISSRWVERTAARLTKEGRLKHVGPRNGGHWEVLE